MSREPDSEIRLATESDVRLLAFDQHGTLSDNEGAFQEAVNNYWNAYQESPSDEWLREMHDTVYVNQGYVVEYVRPIPGSIDLIRDLTRIRQRVVSVSKSDAKAHAATMAWLHRYELGSLIAMNISTGRSRSKSTVLHRGMFFVFVENNFSDALDLYKSGVSRHVILLLKQDAPPGLESMYRREGLLPARGYEDIRREIFQLLQLERQIA